MSAPAYQSYDEDLRSLYEARDHVTSAIRHTHAGATGRINLSDAAKAARAPLFKRRDQICRLIHIRKMEERS